MTKIIDMNPYRTIEELNEPATALKNGELVIFPTETVYGIGANIYNEIAVKNIFKTKGRVSDNPLIVHISNFDMLNDLVLECNEIEKKLIDAFFPGPFTLVLPKTNKVNTTVTSGLDTVGIRMPDNRIARDLIELAGVPVAAPSANISTRPSGTRVEDIKEEFNDLVPYIIDGGSTQIGIESTVVKVIDDIPVILRPGKITPEDIKEVVGVVKVSNTVYKKSTGSVESPGMKYKHYAPNTPCTLIYSDNHNKLVDYIKTNGSNKVIIGNEELKNEFLCPYISYGSENDLDEISRNIFRLLREVDQYNANEIIIIGVKKEGLGIAIMNRLIRAAEYNYIEL